MDTANEMRLPDSQQEKGLSPSQPAPTPGPSAGQGGPEAARVPSTPNDKG